MAGHFGLKAEEWMLYLAAFGGIVLTFLAGAEIDVKLMKEKFKESFLIGSFAFLFPFIGTALYTYYAAHWSLQASLIAGTALSTAFITDMGTALALSLLFMKPTLYTLIFVAVSIIVIIFAARFSHLVFNNAKWKDRVIEPEIKYLFLLLFVFMYFAKLGDGHAVLPAFLLGLFMSGHFSESSATKVVRNRLRTVAYAIVTPVFFIVGGLKVSVPMIASAFGLFVILFVLKIVMKFLGVYFLARKYIPNGTMYTTLLMSTGLTFGIISSVFGLTAGIIEQTQYSILVGVVIASAVIPTFIAQKWFMPVEEEDLVDWDSGNGTA